VIRHRDPSATAARHVPTTVESLSVLLAFIGIVFIALSLASVIRSAQVRRWPTVRGKVVASEVRFRWYGRSNLRKVRRTTHIYDVDGRQFRSDVVRLEANVLVQGSGAHYYSMSGPRYSVGDDVHVSYNPSRPGNAVLEMGDPKTLLRQTYLGAGLVVAAIMLRRVAQKLKPANVSARFGDWGSKDSPPPRPDPER